MEPSLDDILSELRTQEDDALDEAIEEQLIEEFSLEQFRLKQGITQVEIAEKLGKDQSTIAKIEKRLDNKLSTLHSYVEALGRKLVLLAEFPD